MKNYVKEYRGHKVPEGATHWMDNVFAKWMDDYKICTIGCFQGSTWKTQSYGMPRIAIELPEAPMPSKAEWIPKVGSDCDAVWLELPDGGGNDFCQVTIKGYFGDEVWFSKVNGVEYSEVMKVTNCKFRPLKTQKEKDREAFVDAAINEIETKAGLVAPDSGVFEILFDAGFKAPKVGQHCVVIDRRG